MADMRDHSAEKIPLCAFGQKRLGEGCKGTMHVVRRRRGGNPIEIGSRHIRPLMALESIALWTAYRAIGYWTAATA